MIVPSTIHGVIVLASAQKHEHTSRDQSAVVLLARNDDFVTAVVSPATLQENEWALGHYFPTYQEAVADFIARLQGNVL